MNRRSRAGWLRCTLQIAAVIGIGVIHGTCSASSDRHCLARDLRSDVRLDRAVDSIVNAALEDGFSGQVAIARNDRLIYSRAAGFSDNDHEVPVTAATLFQVSSLTKYLTATLVMAALDQGRLDTADSVRSLAPGTHLAQHDITFAQLLSHRSGLGSSYAAEGLADADAALGAIDRQPFDADRIGQFHYSNDGYDTLAILIERLYRRPFEALVREEVFEPACMHHARLWADLDARDPRRVGQPVEPISAGLFERNYGFLGSMGMLVNADDLVAFEVAMHSGRVLRRSTYEELIRPRVQTSIGMAAYGAFVSQVPGIGTRIAALGSEDWGDNAILADYPDCGFVVAVVTSKGPLEVKGDRLFRSRISSAIEPLLAKRCSKGPPEPAENRKFAGAVGANGGQR